MAIEEDVVRTDSVITIGGGGGLLRKQGVIEFRHRNHWGNSGSGGLETAQDIHIKSIKTDFDQANGEWTIEIHYSL